MKSPLSSFAAQLRRQTGWRRELLWLAVALAVGLLLMPLLIWSMGRLTLGAYANGGAFALWRDFLRGLLAGGTPFWAIAVGPYLAVLLLRLLTALLRRTAT